MVKRANMGRHLGAQQPSTLRSWNTIAHDTPKQMLEYYSDVLRVAYSVSCIHSNVISVLVFEFERVSTCLPALAEAFSIVPGSIESYPRRYIFAYVPRCYRTGQPECHVFCSWPPAFSIALTSGCSLGTAHLLDASARTVQSYHGCSTGLTVLTAQRVFCCYLIRY